MSLKKSSTLLVPHLFSLIYKHQKWKSIAEVVNLFCIPIRGVSVQFNKSSSIFVCHRASWQWIYLNNKTTYYKIVRFLSRCQKVPLWIIHHAIHRLKQLTTTLFRIIIYGFITIFLLTETHSIKNIKLLFGPQSIRERLVFLTNLISVIINK